ncbi:MULTISPECIES: ABC transporter permease [unclassified Actinomyces]|uniref:ABC transporter permease n=1 Tax=unclassified Actinomyces TaxID=2609248 RepID=UPI0020170F66|nr:MULTISPECIES: ABC transporter permease [unclassified Actinomyces]MCL3777205.1 ABC transporter permease [Actinomyces sp. AC-20-1]MCL3789280.1 ABC transporter permease [Actinomyces sp. 187325]MCL3791700.1 ABC transporter permease [Actinomyces sp. 186855]MCL3794260.1 ABC transporter permease [Actinomyces sp. 217892]
MSTSASLQHAPRRAALIDLMAVEALKLRRSLVWVFTLLLPALTVITGSVNYAGNQGVLSPGWASYTSQVTLFYGLLFLSVGVALVCAAVWRPEHRGTSWNAMRTTPASVAQVAVAKTLVTMVPVLAMQVVLVSLTWLSGAVVLRLPGGLPAVVAVAGALTVVAALPLVALQSLLAMVLRSFGTPVALGLVGTVVGIALSVKASALARLWPYSLVTSAQSLGSTALSGSGALDWAGIGPVLVGAAASGVICWGLLVAVAARSARR